MLKENKFLIGLGAATALVSGGLIFMGLSASSKLEETQAEIDTKQSSLKRMQQLDPYPTPENAEAKEASLVDVIEAAEKAREELLEFNPEDMIDIPASEFSEQLKASVSRIEGLFPGEDALPKEFTLGFKEYANYLPPEEATGEMAYQLGAMEYLFTELAAAGATEVLNLHRAKLPMEDGKDWDGNDPGSSGRSGRAPRPRSPRPGPGSRGRQPAEVLPKIAHRMPVEVTFRASEAATRDFLTRLGNSDEYFFQTRLARVENPAPIPSGEGDSDSTASNEPAGVVFDDDPADAPAGQPVESKPILEQVSGDEDLNVFLRLDLLVFLESETFPKIK